MFSIIYRPPLPRSCSVLFQFHTQGLPEFASQGGTERGRGVPLFGSEISTQPVGSTREHSPQ
jgi:hypothetical protein